MDRNGREPRQRNSGWQQMWSQLQGNLTNGLRFVARFLFQTLTTTEGWELSLLLFNLCSNCFFAQKSTAGNLLFCFFQLFLFFKVKHGISKHFSRAPLKLGFTGRSCRESRRKAMGDTWSQWNDGDRRLDSIPMFSAWVSNETGWLEKPW